MLKKGSYFNNMIDGYRRAWHKRRLKTSYKRFTGNTNRLKNLKEKIFLQGVRIFTRFLKYYPSKNINQEELISIAKKKKVEFKDLNRLTDEIRNIAILLQNHNQNDELTKDLQYVREEILNLQDFYRELDKSQNYEDLKQRVIPLAGLDLTNRMEERLLKLSTKLNLQAAYQDQIATKPERKEAEDLSIAQSEPIPEQENKPNKSDPEEELSENENTQTDKVSEAQTPKIDAAEFPEQNFDGIPKFHGLVHRVESNPINASMAIQPQIKQALNFHDAELPELDSLDLLAANQIHVELPIKNNRFSESETILLPIPPGYQASHLSQKDTNGDPALSPLKLSQNPLGMVELTNDAQSDVAKIDYSLKKQAIQFDEKTKRDLTLEIADPIDLEMHDSLIDKLPSIEEKIPFLANKVFSSVSFDESLTEAQTAQLNLMVCNEFRRAGIASYISINGQYTADPDRTDRVMVEPHSYSIVYFDENGEAHEFMVSEARIDIRNLISPRPKDDRANIICEYSLLKPDNFQDDQEFLRYYSLEIEQGKTQWQRNIRTRNCSAIVKHLAELERINDSHISFHNTNGSIVDIVNNFNDCNYGEDTPQTIKKIINQTFFMDRHDTKEDLIKRLKSDPELRKAIRDFVFKSFDTFFFAEQYCDVDNDEMYIKHLFEGLLSSTNIELFAAIFTIEDLKQLSLDELEAYIDHPMFSSEKRTFENVKEHILSTIYRVLLDKKAKILSENKEPNEQMNKLLDRASSLLVNICSFSAYIADDYYGDEPILDDGYDCTPSLVPSEAYKLMGDLTQNNPEHLESLVADSVFSGRFAAFLNTKKHSEKSRLCDLILKKNPAPNIFLIKDGKILLQDSFKLKLRTMMQEKLQESDQISNYASNSLIKQLTILYKFGVDTQGIISDDEFGKFLAKGKFDRREIQMDELYDLDIEAQDLDLPCPERGIKFKPKDDDAYRLKLYRELPGIKPESHLVAERIVTDSNNLNPIIEVDFKRTFSSPSDEAWSAAKITNLSKLYKLAGPRDQLENPSRLSEEFYNQVYGELTRRINPEEVNKESRPSFASDLFLTLSIDDKIELIEKYSPEFLLLLKSLRIEVEKAFPKKGDRPPIPNAKQEIENEIERINDLRRKDNPDYVNSDPLFLESSFKEFTGNNQSVQYSAINFLEGVYNILDPSSQKILDDKLCSTLDQDLNESDDAMQTIDEAVLEACSGTIFSKDIKGMLRKLSDFSKRLLRHRIIYEVRLKEPLKSNWQCLDWHSDALFDQDNNPLSARPAQDLIRSELPGLSPDSVFNHLARMNSSSYAFNYILNETVCRSLEECLLEGSYEWTRAKKINDSLSKHKSVKLESEPIIKSKTHYGYSGSRPGRISGSIVYEYSRPYAQGDDGNKMDWNLFARTGKPHTKIMSDDIELRNQEYIIDLSWLNYNHKAINEGYVGVEPFENLIQFIYQNTQKENNQTLTITCHGVPILQLSKDEINKIVDGKEINDQYGNRTRIMDLYLSLRALASANLSLFDSVECPIITEPYLPRYSNSQVHILIPGGPRSRKIRSSYDLFETWSVQKGSEILVANWISKAASHN